MPIIHNMANEEYHSKTEYLSSSQLKVAYHDIEKFKMYYIDKQVEYKSSQALNLGTAVHCALLEPDEFEKRFYLLDTSELNLRTKKDRELVEQLKVENSKKMALSAKDYEVIDGIKKSVDTYDTAKTLLMAGDAELSIFNEDWILPQKIRPDRINMKHKMIIDLKTTARGVTPDLFFRNAFALDYDLSAYNYIDVANREFNEDSYSFIWVVVSTEKPYSVAVYEAGHLTLGKGREKYVRAIERIVNAKETGIYRNQLGPQNSDIFFERKNSYQPDIVIDF